MASSVCDQFETRPAAAVHLVSRACEKLVWACPVQAGRRQVQADRPPAGADCARLIGVQFRSAVDSPGPTTSRRDRNAPSPGRSTSRSMRLRPVQSRPWRTVQADRVQFRPNGSQSRPQGVHFKPNGVCFKPNSVCLGSLVNTILVRCLRPNSPRRAQRCVPYKRRCLSRSALLFDFCCEFVLLAQVVTKTLAVLGEEKCCPYLLLGVRWWLQDSA